MKCNWKKLATDAITSLSPEEREVSIVYLEQRLIPAGEQLPWPGVQQSFDIPVVMVFVDLEPSLNWTHQARYIILDSEGNVQKTVDVDRPPYLTGVSSELKVIHRGSRAPEWACITPELLS